MPTVPTVRSPLLPRIIILLCLAGLLALFGWNVSQVKTNNWDRVARARSYLDRGQPDLAIRAVSEIRDDGPGAAEGLTLAARAFVMRGNLSTARRALEQSLKMKPEQPEAAKILAAIYLAASEGRRGIALLKDAARLDPGDYHPWSAMGKVYHEYLNQLDAAIEAYTQALRRSPPAAEAREARLGRLRALLDAKQADLAAPDLDELRRQTPDDPQVLALAARQASDLVRLDEAMDLANRVLSRDPDNVEALLVRARLQVHARRPKLAIADLEAAVRVKPNDIGALQLLAQAQQTLGLTQEAAATRQRADRSRNRETVIVQLTKAIEARPDDPELRWRLGQAAMEGDMYVLAYQSFQAALDLDPRYQPARTALERLRTQKGVDSASGAGLQLPSRSEVPRSRP